MLKSIRGLLFAALLAAPACSQEPPEKPLPYAKALEKADLEGKVLIVQVGADWCQPCKILKGTINEMRANGEFKEYVYTYFDCDTDPKLSEQLLTESEEKNGVLVKFVDRRIPALIVFRKKDNSWNRRSIRGILSKDKIRELIEISR